MAIETFRAVSRALWNEKQVSKKYIVVKIIQGRKLINIRRFWPRKLFVEVRYLKYRRFGLDVIQCAAFVAESFFILVFSFILELWSQNMRLWQECLAQPPLWPEFFPELVFHIWCLWLYPINYLHLTLQNGGPYTHHNQLKIFQLKIFQLKIFKMKIFKLKIFRLKIFIIPAVSKVIITIGVSWILEFSLGGCKLNRFSESLIWFLTSKFFKGYIICLCTKSECIPLSFYVDFAEKIQLFVPWDRNSQNQLTLISIKNAFIITNRFQYSYLHLVKTFLSAARM